MKLIKEKVTKTLIFVFALLLIIIFYQDGQFQIQIFPMFLLVSVFFGFKDQSSDESAPIKRKTIIWKFLLIGTIFGLITELLAILNNWNLPDDEKILFHPDPIIDMILAVSYYAPVFLLAGIIITKRRFNIAYTFIAGGIYGILTENNMTIFISFNMFLWIYVFLVYGSFISIPYIILKNKIQKIVYEGKKESKNIIYLILYLLIGFALATISMALLWISLQLP